MDASIAELYAHAMSIEGTVYRHEVVRLADLFTVQNDVTGYRFDNCLLVGPAAVMFLDGVSLEECIFIGPPEALTIEMNRQGAVIGILGFRHTLFRGCRFDNIAMVGNADFVRQFRREVLGL